MGPPVWAVQSGDLSPCIRRDALIEAVACQRYRPGKRSGLAPRSAPDPLSPSARDGGFARCGAGNPVLNSHDGSGAYQLRLGLYRTVCTNGLVVSAGTFPILSVAHRGDMVADVVRAALHSSERFEALAGSGARGTHPAGSARAASVDVW